MKFNIYLVEKIELELTSVRESPIAWIAATLLILQPSTYSAVRTRWTSNKLINRLHQYCIITDGGSDGNDNHNHDHQNQPHILAHNELF